jgi:hypothetical protein
MSAWRWGILIRFARMLDGDKEGLRVRRQLRLAHLRPVWHAEEELRGSARRPFRLLCPDADGAAGARGGVAVGRDPQPPVGADAQLSHMPNQPSFAVAGVKVAPTAEMAGSPHLTGISQRNPGAAWSRPSGSISMMWPNWFSGCGLAASVWSALPRELLVIITQTLSVFGLASSQAA